MNILTIDNQPYDLNSVPPEIDDIRYCVFDCSDPKFIDHYYVPLVFLESFYSPAAVLTIGNQTVQIPLDWSILVCDEEFNELDIMPITSLDDRGFHAVLYNPRSANMPLSAEVNIVNVYTDIKWFFPKLKPSTMLAVPLEDKPNPVCAYFVKEFTKVPKIELGDLIG